MSALQVVSIIPLICAPTPPIKETIDDDDLHAQILEEIEMLTLGSLRRAVFDGDMDTGSIMAGQSAGLVKKICTVQEILNAIYDDSRYAKGILK